MAEAEGAQSVVDRDDDDVAPGGERGAVVPGGRTLAVLVGATVDPHVDGASGVVGRRRHHVEGQAVLVPGNGHLVGEALAGELRRRLPEAEGIADAVPRFVGDGSGEAALADWWLGIGDAGEEFDAAAMASANRPAGGLCKGSGRPVRWLSQRPGHDPILLLPAH